MPITLATLDRCNDATGDLTSNPLLEQRISEVVSLCEQEVQEDYREFYSILKEIKNDPGQINTYFYKLEDLFVKNIRVAEIGYILGLVDNIK